MRTKALFLSGGGSYLILGIGTENQIIIPRTPAAIKCFHRILKKYKMLLNVVIYMHILRK